MAREQGSDVAERDPNIFVGLGLTFGGLGGAGIGAVIGALTAEVGSWVGLGAGLGIAFGLILGAGLAQAARKKSRGE